MVPREQPAVGEFSQLRDGCRENRRWFKLGPEVLWCWCQVFQLCFSYLTFLQLTFCQAVRRILNFTLKKNSCTVHTQHLNATRARHALLPNWRVLARLALVSFSLPTLTPSTEWPGWAEKGSIPSSAASSCNLAALPLFDYSNHLAEIAVAECVSTCAPGNCGSDKAEETISGGPWMHFTLHLCSSEEHVGWISKRMLDSCEGEVRTSIRNAPSRRLNHLFIHCI